VNDKLHPGPPEPLLALVDGAVEGVFLVAGGNVGLHAVGVAVLCAGYHRAATNPNTAHRRAGASDSTRCGLASRDVGFAIPEH
jgi:hypothetical protein